MGKTEVAPNICVGGLLWFNSTGGGEVDEQLNNVQMWANPCLRTQGPK